MSANLIAHILCTLDTEPRINICAQFYCPPARPSPGEIWARVWYCIVRPEASSLSTHKKNIDHWLLSVVLSTRDPERPDLPLNGFSSPPLDNLKLPKTVQPQIPSFRLLLFLNWWGFPHPLRPREKNLEKSQVAGWFSLRHAELIEVGHGSCVLTRSIVSKQPDHH